MKNMKKLTMLLVGCLMSLYVMAETEATCQAPQNVRITNVSYRSVDISWTKHTSHAKYEIRYWKKANHEGFFSVEDILSTNTSWTVDGLQPSTTYEIWMVAKCTNNEWSDDSQVLTFTTPAKPTCKTPTNVKVSDITDKSATISWTKGESSQDWWQIKCEVAGTSTYYTYDVYDYPTYSLSGLNYNTDYYVSVRAAYYDEPSGEMFYSEYSDGKAFKTAATPSPEDIPQMAHEINLQSDPYTCLATQKVTLHSTYKGGAPEFISFYEINYGGIVSVLAENASFKTMDLYPSVGEHMYVVAAADKSVNAPRRMPEATQAEPSSNWPSLIADQKVKQYDVWKVHVKYHMETHTVTVTADLITNKAEFQVYTTAGSVDPATGKTFCGLALKYKLNQGTSEDVTDARIIDFKPANVDDVLTLGIGSYTYSGYIVSREGYIYWCDRFNINVVAANCTSGLVYSKWDDFLFVDNGDGGGKGKFVSYQWYKDGHKLDGATYQWYRSTLPQFENAMPSGQYYVRIKDVDGNEIITCPKVFSDFPRSEASNHHNSSNAPARKQIVNGQLRIEYNGKWYNAQGMEIK